MEMKTSTSSEKLDKFQQMLKRSTTKEAPAVAAKSASSSRRGRSLSTARVPSTRRVNQEQKNLSRGRGRSHSKPRKSQQAPLLTAKEKADHSSTAPKSSHRERSKSRSSKRLSRSAACSRSSRSQSCRRSKTDLRSSKSAADVRVGVSAADMTVEARPLPVDKSGRSRSMSRSRPNNISSAYASLYSPPQGTSAPSLPPQTNNTSQGKDAMLRRSDERTRSTAETVAPRRFIVEVDDDMNILQLKEVLSKDESQLPRNYLPYRKSRRRSSSCEPPSRSQREAGSPTSDEYRRSRRRSSSCEPPVLRSSLKSSRSRSELNQSVSFSIHNENTEDTIRRVSSYSRQPPQIMKDLVDFDPPLEGSLKESTATSSTQDMSTINDDEEDSLAFPPAPLFITKPSENANDKNLQSDYMDSSLAIVGEDEGDDDTTNNVSRPDPSSLPTVQENGSNCPPSLPDSSSKQATTQTKKRGFFRKKTYRRVTNDSELQEKDPSFLNTAADCLKTQQQKQKKKEKSKSRSRFYNILK
jgi:hypothetical protein